jgi:starch phosphorylase
VFEIQVYLNDIAPETVRVELYAEGVDGEAPERHELMRGQKINDAEIGYIFSLTISAKRPATDYTARVIPNFSGVSVPLENRLILWQH